MDSKGSKGHREELFIRTVSEDPEELFIRTVSEDHEAICWGCGLRLLRPSNAPIFKCGWCGAITNQNPRKCGSRCSLWRRLRDRCFLCVLLVFMLFVICGGVWAVYPIVFSINYFCGIFHSIISIILSVTTISSFILAAFQCAGMPPSIQWGIYPVVRKGDLENYTFCHHCSKPKSPRTHHCSSCGMCILDMDHHCPFSVLKRSSWRHKTITYVLFFFWTRWFKLMESLSSRPNTRHDILNDIINLFRFVMIGNCVGAANHRHFILFLISAVISTIYVSIMSAYAGRHIWPPLTLTYKVDRLDGFNMDLGFRVMVDVFVTLLRSALLLSARGLVLVYLFVSCVSVEIGLSVLLWQQLSYIYQGKTYLSHLGSQENGDVGKKDCQNLFRFFGCPYSKSRYLPIFWRSRKRHKR